MEENKLNQQQPSIITTHALSKKFGDLVAVNNLQLEVRRGDVFGFLGPNGSGKTTTIRMLLGLLRPTTGSIRIFGLDNASHLQQILPRIGAIIEAPVYYSDLSGSDNLRIIALNSGLTNGPATARRIEEILTLVDLTSQARDAVRKYSLGMKQRLAIGMALLTDPELILLDEPTNGLDPMGVHEIRQMIQRLAESGKTVILSSHILHEVQQVCNRVAILQKGRVIKQGEVSELLRQGTRLLLRMNTPQEAHMALVCLQRGQEQGAGWIKQISYEAGTELQIDAPAERASEIVALLARQQLYLAELRSQENTLEQIFMDLVAPEEARAGIEALVS